MEDLVELVVLANILKKLDLEKNDNETIKEVLVFVSKNIEYYVKKQIEKL